MADLPATDEELERSTDRWMAVGLVLFALFVLAFPIYRWYEPGRREANREEQAAGLAAHGAELYSVSCASCHGIDGRGGLAPALGTTQFLEMTSDEQVNQLIAVGVPGSEMVAYSIDYFGPLTSEQINAITTYLRSLEDEAVDNPSWRFPLAEEGLTGREIFVLGCARCHGNDLAGTEDGPALGPDSDTAEESDSRLMRRIKEGEDEMPRFDGSLDDGQIQLIIDYIRTVQSGG